MKTGYTAQEMREMALVEESYRWDVVAKMLRQGADAIERAGRRLPCAISWLYSEA